MNAKGDLIARALSLGLGAPEFEVSSDGPPHQRTFHVTVRIGGEALGEGGSGRSRKDAERAAADSALRVLDGEPMADTEEVLDEAIKLAGTTSFEDIMHREAGFLLGVCYQKSGRREKALEILESVLQHDDTHWRARFHTALIAIEERRHEEAEEHLVEVLEHCPDHRQAKALLAKLRELREAAAGRLQPAED